MLDRMEKQDLIQKVENKEDGRSTIICLNEKSKALEKVYQKITIKAKHIRILKIMTGLSPVINE